MLKPLQGVIHAAARETTPRSHQRYCSVGHELLNHYECLHPVEIAILVWLLSFHIYLFNILLAKRNGN